MSGSTRRRIPISCWVTVELLEKPPETPPVGVDWVPEMTGRVSPTKISASLLWVVTMDGVCRMVALFLRGVVESPTMPDRS